MKIKSIKVSNFRALGEARLELGDMTALIGSNGSGKTAILLAIARFFSKARTMNPANFGRKDLPIKVTVVAEGEGREAAEVTREWHLDKNRGKAVSMGYSCGDRTADGLGDFLGARVVYVPAGHEPDKGGRDTVLQSLIDNVAGRQAAGGAEREGPRGVAADDLGRVEETINKKLGARDGIGYSPSICVRLRFGDPVGSTGLMMAITDRETGRELDYAHVGHGARRALHMAALETDADILGGGRAGEGAGHGAATLYVIDEPELHQHPKRQDLIFAALRRLSEGPSSQVVYATHSPRLVALGTQMVIRRVERDGETIRVRGAGGSPVRGGVTRPIGEAIFANGAVLVEGHHDEAIIRAVLQATPHNGGSLMAALASREITVVDCRSKYNIGHYYGTLAPLGIRCFVVWDGDMDTTERPALHQAKRENEKLLEMVGEDPEKAQEIVDSGRGDCMAGENWACFGHNLPAYFAECFHKRAGDLVGIIGRGEDVGQWLDRETLFQSKFYREAVPGIRQTLIG
ncbi:MAG: AAA family ATPase [Thaumarchaeota archaeon]|nr:AAA family ATPase [Nitrososphaerota archaeon]